MAGSPDKIDRVIEETVRRRGGTEPWPGKQDSGEESKKGQVPPKRDDLIDGRAGGHRHESGTDDIPDN